MGQKTAKHWEIKSFLATWRVADGVVRVVLDREREPTRGVAENPIVERPSEPGIYGPIRLGSKHGKKLTL
jgi:hypothetical protein